MGAWMGAMPLVAGFKDVQVTVPAMGNENADSAFDVLDKITKAQNFRKL